MCGRVKLPEDYSETKIQLGLELLELLRNYTMRFNVPPTTPVPVITSDKGIRALDMMHWGLIPAYSDKPKMNGSTFNARAETIATTPAFRGAWKAGRRCLVVTDGFYEWRKADRQPFCIALGNRQLMCMAGLWEEWKRKDVEPVRSCTIVTTEANALLRDIHDRMPVIIGPEDWAAWLGEEPIADPATLLKPFPPERMTLWPVDKRVGNVKNQGPELAEPMKASVIAG